MNSYRYWIPSTLTLINLSLGIFAILLNDQVISLVLVFIALFFDLFDGIIARAINGQSEFGKQLDSLADIVSFGVAPAFLVSKYCFLADSNLRFIVVLIPVFSAIRLAKFNIDTSQKTNFRGLPTPANGLFFASIPYTLSEYNIIMPEAITTVIIVIFAYLLISPIRMFAFKNIKKGGVDSIFPLLFIGIVIACLSVFGLKSIPLGVAIYILMSLIYNALIQNTNTKKSCP
jgi:CDP-diacylglycerol--serine O-phosphatidyltransferase